MSDDALTNSAVPKPLSITIIGGGVGGLPILLGLLHHTNLTVIGPHHYEPAPRFAETEAAVEFGTNSFQTKETVFF